MHLRDIVWHQGMAQIDHSQPLRRIGADDEENKWGWIAKRIRWSDHHVYRLVCRSNITLDHPSLDQFELAVLLTRFEPSPRILRYDP